MTLTRNKAQLTDGLATLSRCTVLSCDLQYHSVPVSVSAELELCDSDLEEQRNCLIQQLSWSLDESEMRDDVAVSVLVGLRKHIMEDEQVPHN